MGLKISIYVISDVQLQSSRTLYSSTTQIIWVRAILQLLDTAKFPRADWDRAHGRPRADLLEHECMINRLWPLLVSVVGLLRNTARGRLV